MALLVLTSLGSAPSEAADEAVSPARLHFKLPEVFDFQHFKLIYKKKYPNLAEELARCRLYLANALRSFLSLVGYKHKQSSSYLATNEMSDLTLDEIIQRGVQGSLQPMASKGKQVLSYEQARESISVADLEDIELQLDNIVVHRHEKPEYEEIARELDPDSSQSDTGAPRIGVTANDLVRLADADIEESEAPPIAGESRWRTVMRNVAEYILNLPSTKYVLDYIGSFLDELSKALATERFYDAPDDFRNLVYVDLRKTKCLSAVRNQGDCGSCYAFATMALFEWAHCMQHGKKVEFSEQYMVDCGRHIGLRGCKGGDLMSAVEFVHNLGLRWRHQYPYLDRQDQCPHKTMRGLLAGSLLMPELQFELVEERDFEKALARSPVLVGVATNAAFSQYGGGVDEAFGCMSALGHAMLLVGHGRQDGMQYWLLRNSSGRNWGERGYYKLSKEANCMLDDHGISLKGDLRLAKARADTGSTEAPNLPSST